MQQKAAGIRTLPHQSAPTAHGPIPAATAAAAPPAEPPAVRSGSMGMRVMPVNGLVVTVFHAKSGVVVVPTKIIPSERNRAATGESSVQDWLGSTAREPRSV